MTQNVLSKFIPTYDWTDGSRRSKIQAAGTPLKWNPGHYVLGDTFANIETDTPEQLGYSTTQLDDYVILGVKGIHVYGFWRRFEDGLNDFSQGFDWMDTLLAECAIRGLRVSFQIVYTSFGGTSARHLPPYLATLSGAAGGWWNKSLIGESGVQAKIGLAPVRNRISAVIAAYGARYNGNPWVEMFQVHESSMAPSSDESKAGMATSYVQWNTDMRTAFPNTLTAAHPNFTNSQSYESDFILDCFTKGMAVAGPDTYPQVTGLQGGGILKAETWADNVMKGNIWSGTAWVSGGTDYRGQIARMSHFADPIHGRGNVGVYSSQQLYDWSYSVNRNSHMYHSPKTYAFGDGYDEVYWNSGTQPRIRDWLGANATSAPTRTTFPSRYAELGYVALTGGT